MILAVVIPLHDRNPVSRVPWVTYGLIAANVVVFLLSPLAVVGEPSARQETTQDTYLYHYGVVPTLLLNGHTNPFWPVLTGMFVHAGWMHLFGNMLFLYIFGNNVEDRLGRIHFLAFYLIGGFAATYAFAFANPASDGPLVGASGAIAAVLGAYAYLYPQAKITLLVPFLFFLPLRVPAWLVLGFWFILQLPQFQLALGSASASDVAYFAHVTGFSLGLLYMAVLFGRGGSAGGTANPLMRPVTPTALAPDFRNADPNNPYGTATASRI